MVSTTRVFPSQRPRESPSHWRIPPGRVRAAVDRDDPRLVDHLDLNGDVSGRLEDLVVVVIEVGNHLDRHRPGNAPLPTVAVEPGIAFAPPLARLLASHEPRDRFRRHRDPSVRGIDDQGGLLQPPARLRPGRSGAAGRGNDRRAGVAVTLHLRLGHLLQRSRRRVVPDPLQVGIAPRRARGSFAAALRRHQGHAQQRGRANRPDRAHPANRQPHHPTLPCAYSPTVGTSRRPLRILRKKP